MRAAIHTQYGPPSVVSIREIPTPVPGPGELLIRVYTSTINRTDAGFRSAEYVISRFWSGLLKPKRNTLGSEFAGVVIQKGQAVSRFQIGDRVFGYNDVKFGGHAEYMVLAESDCIETIPEGISFDMAAPILEGAHYAICNIRASKVKKGDAVMVYGATGAIGSAAVQILRYMDIRVTAVCATPYVDLVYGLGAHKVIDYTREDFTQTAEQYQFIFDAVGKSSFHACKPLLTEQGVYISTELGKHAENVFLALLGMLKRGKKVLFPIPEMKQEDLLFLKQLVEQKHFRPLIDQSFPLEQIVAAYEYVETGRKIGNVLLKIVNHEDV